ncbi:MAG: SH3 domain-containing protein [Bdellovibrionales bacterium]|nr:SH3 domain-containing protein [Bdellovibrionales bacterium]
MRFLRVFFFLFLWSFGAPGEESPSESLKGQAHSMAETPKSAGERFKNSTETLQKAGNLYFYNRGIQLLKEGQKQSALPFLQKSFYQYLFFPAYKNLVHLGHPPVLWPFLWQALALLYGLFSLFWFVFLLKRTVSAPTPFLLKGMVSWFSGLAVLALLGFFSLQKRAGALTEIKGHSAPSSESVELWTAPGGADVKILKMGHGWVQIQINTGQKGWVEEKNLLFTLE